ncbi:MAG: maleylpyruvate isomerase family mycothiol-dependent enzyme [Acidimicrobiia bacterium]
MDAIVAALADQHVELAGLLAGRDEGDWQRPTPCEGWTVADVVLHLAQTDAIAIASARGTLAAPLTELARDDLGRATTVDESADLAVARERGRPGPELFERWTTGAAELRKALSECDPSARVLWVTGELSARTLATTRLAETWIHTGDVAAAFDRTLAPTDRLQHIARLAWRTLPYAFARGDRKLRGPVAFELRGPGGDAWDFVPDEEPLTVIRGDLVELCEVAARRVDPRRTGLRGTGPDATAVLELVRTYA